MSPIDIIDFMFKEQLKTFKGYRGEARHFCRWNRGFACLEVRHTDKPHPVLMKLRARHYDAGLTSQEWDTLLKRARECLEAEEK